MGPKATVTMNFHTRSILLPLTGLVLSALACDPTDLVGEMDPGTVAAGAVKDGAICARRGCMQSWPERNEHALDSNPERNVVDGERRRVEQENGGFLSM